MSSPVTILTAMPSALVSRDRGLGVGARRVEQREEARRSVQVCRRRPSAPRRAPGSRARRDRRPWPSYLPRRGRIELGQRGDRLRRALGVVAGACPAASITVATVRLFTGSNGTKSVCLNLSRRSASASAPCEHGRRRSASSLLRWRGQRRRRTPRRRAWPRRRGSASSSFSWFMVSVPVLSLHSTSTPASSSIADSRETMAFCRTAPGPERHGHRHHRRHRHRHRGDQQDQDELRDRPDGGPAPDVGHDHVAVDLRADQHAAPGRRRAGSGSRRSAARPAAEWDLAPAPATSLAVRPKKVWLPVAVTTAGHRALLGDAAGIGAVAHPLGNRQ